MPASIRKRRFDFILHLAARTAQISPRFNEKVRKMLFTRFLAPCVLVLICLFCLSATAQQTVSSRDRERGRLILSAIKEDLKKNYYDPNFHGMDIDARFKTAEEKIKQATSLGQIFGIIAQTLFELEDSHTFFLPPPRTYKTEYGWQMQMIGDKSYVVAVKPGSDAEAKGLKEGDEIYTLEGWGPTRANLWKIQYLYHGLRPQTGMSLVIIKPDGKEQKLDVMAKVQQGKQVIDLTGGGDGNDIWNLIRESENESRLRRHRYVEIGEDLFIWKMPGFDLLKDSVDDFVNKFRKKKGLILDLRGNHGGYEETLLRLLGNVFDKDVNVGDLKRRKETKPLIAKTRGDNVFSGKLVVLIDSESGSAAELFARLVQSGKRGTIIGDVSAGKVMRSKSYDHQLGVDTVVFYGVSVTDADIIMSDGKSLEHVGVTPDEIRLPTAADLAARRDPVLAYAASLFGIAISPEKAGAMFPIEWGR
jgi:C-terminal processing protease CtpA/Prc